MSSPAGIDDIEPVLIWARMPLGSLPPPPSEAGGVGAAGAGPVGAGPDGGDGVVVPAAAPTVIVTRPAVLLCVVPVIVAVPALRALTRPISPEELPVPDVVTDST